MLRSAPYLIVIGHVLTVDVIGLVRNAKTSALNIAGTPFPFPLFPAPPPSPLPSCACHAGNTWQLEGCKTTDKVKQSTQSYTEWLKCIVDVRLDIQEFRMLEATVWTRMVSADLIRFRSHIRNFTEMYIEAQIERCCEYRLGAMLKPAQWTSLV